MTLRVTLRLTPRGGGPWGGGVGEHSPTVVMVGGGGGRGERRGGEGVPTGVPTQRSVAAVTNVHYLSASVKC